MSTVRPHVPEEELHAFHDGELSPAQRSEIAEHLIGCLICRALNGEVTEVRSRATVLLGRATPRVIHRPATRRKRNLSVWRGPIAAGLFALVGGSAWFATRPGQVNTPQLSTAFTTPGLFADFRSITTPSAPDATKRSLLLIEKMQVRPRVLAPMVLPSLRPILEGRPAEDVDPVGGADWEQVTLEGAIEASHGVLPRLEGLPVAKVQIHRGSNGDRPTTMVRQQTPDGRAVWVVEGPVEEITALRKTFEASGLSMSMPLRARSEYGGTDANPTRTDRSIAMAGYLPADSLDALTLKLKRN